jgi:hypothetical protein
LTSATEHVALGTGTTVATFTDSDISQTASAFTATINWGDGTTSAGTVSGSNGSFAVTGGHTYADEGNEGVSVTLTRTSDNANAVASGTVVVGENDAFTAHAVAFRAEPNQAFSGTVATFTDTDTVTTVGDLAASINWGDGTTTTGAVTGSNGSFTVTGGHPYADEGSDPVGVSMTRLTASGRRSRRRKSAVSAARWY